jgi:hypothetical protein
MTAEERELRGELGRLAATGRGRALLQLSLRGIHHGEQAVTAGCWRDPGVAGCLFQHAYWQGVREEVFPDEGRPGDWIGSFMGAGGYGVVVDTIGAFDRLAKRQHADVRRRLLLPDKVDVRLDEWRAVVERMLVEALAETGAPDAERNRVLA